ncbi:MAG: hypothetical protein PWP11_2996 [Thauera sp.]|nr:hypothetical protein [Thauera sp.]MDI3491719.1 hypothetical protein [Thauera sp.]
MAVTDTTRSPTWRRDIAGYFASCSEAFGQLASIARAIEEQSKDERPGSMQQLRNLAGAAKYIADDLENMSDCWREEITLYGVINE